MLTVTFSISLALENDPLKNEQLLKGTIELDKRQNSRYLAQNLKVPCSFVHKLLTQNRKTCKLGNWIPRELSFEIRTNHSTICNSFNQECQILILVSHCSRWWKMTFAYQQKTKKKNSNYHRMRNQCQPEKPGLLSQKYLLCVWGNMKIVVYYDLVEPDRIITSYVYCQQLYQMWNFFLLWWTKMMFFFSMILQGHTLQNKPKK